MDIRFYTASSPYQTLEYRSAASVSEKSKAITEKAAANYDKASFHQTQTCSASDDSSFAALLTQTVSARLSKGTDPAQVARLRQQIADGSYQPDSRRIAERILGYR